MNHSLSIYTRTYHHLYRSHGFTISSKTRFSFNVKHEDPRSSWGDITFIVAIGVDACASVIPPPTPLLPRCTVITPPVVVSVSCGEHHVVVHIRKYVVSYQIRILSVPREVHCIIGRSVTNRKRLQLQGERIAFERLNVNVQTHIMCCC